MVPDKRFPCIALAFIVLVVFTARTPLIADVAYIIKQPAGDRDVSIIFSYDAEEEADILSRIGEEGHILQWQIQCTEKYVFYRPFEFTQGRFSVRPVMCLVRKFRCLSDYNLDGYVYQGYLFLEPVFDLSSPLKITLADKAVQATFLR